MFFASDNGAPVHPQVMAAMASANSGNAMPYGNDPVTRAAEEDLRHLFDAPEAVVCFTGSGTSANALALATLSRPWSGIWCHPLAHVNTDECGAPEFYTDGAKMLEIPGPEGRITPEGLAAAIASRGVTVHTVQASVLSLSNLTETGLHYTLAELAALCRIAQDAGYRVHLDGARLGNALAACNGDPAALVRETGIDILSFGGAKGGMMTAEAVIAFDPAVGQELALRRKRAGHLTSKMRYIGAQFSGWLRDGLWLDLARDANARAAELRAGLGERALLLPGAQGNIVFADLSEEACTRAAAAGAQFYRSRTIAARDGRRGVRLVTSWATTPEEVARFVELVL